MYLNYCDHQFKNNFDKTSLKTNYIACQLYGITQLVPLFCLTPGENLGQRQYKVTDNI